MCASLDLTPIRDL